MNHIRYLPLSVFFIVLPVLAETNLPENKEVVCRAYKAKELKKCNSLYEEAAKGQLKALVSIGSVIRNQPLPESADIFQHSLDGISRNERAIKWFKLASDRGLLEANYWVAETIKDSFDIAAITPAVDSVASESKEIKSDQLLKSALRVGLPVQAFLAAQGCSISPGCMKILGEFYERGFGTAVSDTLAAEWYAKSAIKYSAIGNRDAAIKSFEILASKYPAYPYTSEVKKQLFPQPKNEQERQPTEKKTSA